MREMLLSSFLSHFIYFKTILLKGRVLTRTLPFYFFYSKGVTQNERPTSIREV